jgi:hypothetical protein
MRLMKFEILISLHKTAPTGPYPQSEGSTTLDCLMLPSN